MQTNYSQINEIGLAEIKQFLADNHKKGGEHFTDSMLRAWAADAEVINALNLIKD